MDETRRLIERAHHSSEEGREVAARTKLLLQTSRQIQRWSAGVQGRITGEFGTPSNRYCNQLLSLLPKPEFDRLAPFLESVSFSPKEVLHHANTAIKFVYFPFSGLLSSTLTMYNGSPIEIAPIGNEGMAGLLAIVGNHISPLDVSVQVAGQGLRIDVINFQAEMRRGGLFHSILAGYLSACTVMNARQIACNGLHDVSKRCCRRLLTTQDRLATSNLPLTHESLALTLGVRRPTVSEVVGSLQKRGVVITRRGHINIIDRPQLSTLTCECYLADCEAWERLRGLNGGRAGHSA